MKIIHHAATRPDQRKVFDGHQPRQVTGGADQHDHSTHPFPIKIINTPWQLINLSITFSSRRINYSLTSWWQSRSSWENITSNGGGNE